MKQKIIDMALTNWADVVKFAPADRFAPDDPVFRIMPEITYNLGKVALGAEYMLTSVQYGTPDAHKRVVENAHWVSNHRLQIMAKYTF